nr:MAG TPA_asm: hypothetical protein [Caudoviricetes sp.]
MERRSETIIAPFHFEMYGIVQTTTRYADYESSSGTVQSLMLLLIHSLVFRLFILQQHILIFIGIVLV